jgi:hypothetical protein
MGRILLVVRGRVVRLLVRVVGLCRRVGWGKRVFFVIIVRGHHKRTKRGKSRYRIIGAFETHHTLQQRPRNFTCFCQSHPKTCHQSHAVGV